MTSQLSGPEGLSVEVLTLHALIVVERVAKLDILPVGRRTSAIVIGFYTLLGIM